MPLPASNIPNAVPSYVVKIDDPTNTSTDPNAMVRAADINQLESDVLALAAAVLPGGTFNPTAIANGAVNNHVAAADPHSQYYNQARGDVRYAQLAAADPFAQYLTQARGDGRYAQLAAADPFSQYLTQARGDGRYAQLGAADPFAQYLNQARGDARYVALAATHTRSIRFPLLNPSGTFPLILPGLRMPYGGTVTAVWCYVLGGTNAVVNARKVSGGTPTSFLAANFTNTTVAGGWVSAGALVAAPATTFAAGDSLDGIFQGISGSVSFVSIQVDYTEQVAP